MNAIAFEYRLRAMRIVMLLSLPGIALAADTVVRGVPVTLIQIATFLGVQTIAMFSYLAASLSDWASWKDDSGTALEAATRKLKLLQGMLIGMLSGNICFYGGTVGLNAENLAGFISAGLGAYGGDRVLTPLLQRVIGK